MNYWCCSAIWAVLIFSFGKSSQNSLQLQQLLVPEIILHAKVVDRNYNLFEYIPNKHNYDRYFPLNRWINMTGSDKVLFWKRKSERATLRSFLPSRIEIQLLNCRANYPTRWTFKSNFIITDDLDLEYLDMNYRIEILCEMTSPFSKQVISNELIKSATQTQLIITSFHPKFESSTIACVHHKNESVTSKLYIFQRFNDQPTRPRETPLRFLNLNKTVMIPCKVHDPANRPILYKRNPYNGTWDPLNGENVKYNWRTGFVLSQNYKYFNGDTFACVSSEAVSKFTLKDNMESITSRLTNVTLALTKLENSRDWEFTCSIPESQEKTSRDRMNLKSIRVEACDTPDYCHFNREDNTTRQNTFCENKKHCTMTTPKYLRDDLSNVDLQGKVICFINVDDITYAVEDYYFLGVSGTNFYFLSRNPTAALNQIIQLRVAWDDAKPNTKYFTCIALSFLTFPYMKISVTHMDQSEIEIVTGILQKYRDLTHGLENVEILITSNVTKVNCHVPWFNSTQWLTTSYIVAAKEVQVSTNRESSTKSNATTITTPLTVQTNSTEATTSTTTTTTTTATPTTPKTRAPSTTTTTQTTTTPTTTTTTPTTTAPSKTTTKTITKTSTTTTPKTTTPKTTTPTITTPKTTTSPTATPTTTAPTTTPTKTITTTSTTTTPTTTATPKTTTLTTTAPTTTAPTTTTKTITTTSTTTTPTTTTTPKTTTLTTTTPKTTTPTTRTPTSTTPKSTTRTTTTTPKTTTTPRTTTTTTWPTTTTLPTTTIPTKIAWAPLDFLTGSAVLLTCLGLLLLIGCCIHRYCAIKFLCCANNSATHRIESYELKLMNSKRAKLSIPSKYLISAKDLSVDYSQIAGQGQFSTVHKGNLKKSAKVSVLVKVNKIAGDSISISSLINDVHMRILVGGETNENITAILGSYFDRTAGKVYIAMQFKPQRNAREFLTNKNMPMGQMKILNMPPHEMVQTFCTWLQGILKGLEFLHSKKIVHGNLAAENILVCLQNTSSVSITGFSHSLQLTGDLTYFVKTRSWTTGWETSGWRWMPMESLRYMEFSKESDVWSFGVLMWEIFSLGAFPYLKFGYTNLTMEFIQKLEFGSRLLQPQLAPREIYRLMEACWSRYGKDRPKASELCEYFNQDQSNLNNYVNLAK